MRISKKIFAAFLATLMAISMMPFTALAAEAVAEVNGTSYETFEDALAAISNATTAKHSNAVDPNYDYKTYVANGNITLLANCTSNGIIIGSGSNLVVDLNGHTLDINAKPVGSNGTESIALQLLKGSDITFKNGTLTSSYTYASTNKEHIQRLIQNYANLTFDDVDVTFKGNFKNQATISHCNGNLVLTNGSTLAAPDFSRFNYTVEEAATNLGAVAAFVGTFSTYTDASATVDDGAITGNVKVQVLNPETAASNTLTLTSGSINGDIVMGDNADDVKVSKAETFTQAAPEGYEWVAGETAGTQELAKDTHSVAEVNGTKYNSFEDALAAISTVTTATHSKATDPTYQYKTYVANGTIKLLQNCTSNGIIIGSNSNLTIDFNGKTLDITDKPVGSNGTETIGMQLLKDSDITFKNGTLTSTADSSKKIVRLIQNYADLTLNNMTVSMKGNFYDQMTMSNCNGDVTITGSTVSAPDFSWAGYSNEQAAESLGTRVMSVGSFSTAYPEVNVTVKDSTINGYVNIDNSAEGANAELKLNNADVNGNIVDKNMNGATVKSEGTTTVDGIPAGYEWAEATGILAPVENAFNLTVEDEIHMNLYVNADAYGADEITVTYSDPDKQNGATKTETFDVADLDQDAKGRYAVKILAAPAQIRDEVTVTAGSNTFTTTVAAYCEAIIAQSNDAKLVALAKSMLDYGKAASDEFNYNESAFASQDYFNTADVTSALESRAIINGINANNKFRSYAYIAKSVPALRIYLNTTEAEVVRSGLRASVNGEEVEIKVVEGTSNVCVDITGILAEDLDKEFIVEFNGGLITINALQYAKALGGNTDFSRSMYNYCTAAEAYFV